MGLLKTRRNSSYLEERESECCAKDNTEERQPPNSEPCPTRKLGPGGGNKGAPYSTDGFGHDAIGNIPESDDTSSIDKACDHIYSKDKTHKMNIQANKV